MIFLMHYNIRKKLITVAYWLFNNHSKTTYQVKMNEVSEFWEMQHDVKIYMGLQNIFFLVFRDVSTAIT